MKRSTVVRHLVEVGGGDEQAGSAEYIGGVAAEGDVGGGDVRGAVEPGGAVVLLLDVPSAELSWLVLHPVGEYVGEVLGLGKRPLSWWYRPASLPVGTVEHRRVVRFCSAAGGLDEGVIEALRRGDLAEAPVVEPAEAELDGQLRDDLAAARVHLRDTLDRYWDREWCRGHKPPEAHLWRAAEAVSRLQSTLDDG